MVENRPRLHQFVLARVDAGLLFCEFLLIDSLQHS